MKKIIAVLTMLVLALGLFAGCDTDMEAYEALQQDYNNLKKEYTALEQSYEALEESLAALQAQNTTLTTMLKDAQGTTDQTQDATDSDTALADDLVYYADIDIAGYGKITLKLDRSAAPATVANFVKLTESGFYNGLTFHRIMEGFMMQGGCPYGTGIGGASENVVGEFAANGYTNNLSHTRGAISMARASDPNSGSSQFFIVHEDSIFLDGQYACFGYVTEGMDVVDAVCTKAEPTDDNGTIPASAQPVINSITIRTEAK